MQTFKYYELISLVVEQGKRKLEYFANTGKIWYYYNGNLQNSKILYYEQARKFLRKHMGKDNQYKCIKGGKNDRILRNKKF